MIILQAWPVLFTILLAPISDNWPDFRGPNGDGRAGVCDLPINWSESHNVRWKTPIPGSGWSTPVIWGDQVWLTTATTDGKRMSAIGLNRSSGEITHNVVVFETDHPE